MKIRRIKSMITGDFHKYKVCEDCIPKVIEYDQLDYNAKIIIDEFISNNNYNS